MKKYLLFVALLGGFATGFLDLAAAPKGKDPKPGVPTVTISGGATFSTNSASPDLKYYAGEDAAPSIKNNQKSTGSVEDDTSATRMVAGDAEIDFSARGQLENGVRYGAEFCLYAMKMPDTYIDKMYLFFERDNVGTLNAGNIKGPDGKFLCGAQQLIGGTAGIDGSIGKDIVEFATGVVLPINVIGYSSKATKIAYYSPIIHGFQAGIALTADTKHQGRAPRKNHGTVGGGNNNDIDLFALPDDCKEEPYGKNNVALALRHEYKINKDWKTNFAAIYVTENTQPINTNCYVGDVINEVPAVGKEGDANYVAKVPASTPVSRKIKLRNASSWQVTGTVAYKGFSVGAGYLNNGKSRLPKLEEYTSADNKMVIPGGFMTAKDGNAGRAWNVGMKYEIGKWAFATVYHKITRKITEGQTAKGDMYTLTADYNICPGLCLFGEIDYVATKSTPYACSVYNLVRKNKTAIIDQKTTVFVFGAKVSF